MRSEVTKVVEEELLRVEGLARAGDVDSMIYLGWAYDRFGILEYNEERAEYWFRLAAKTDDIEGLRRLARFLSDRNRTEAEKVATTLVNRGDFFGHYLLGHGFLQGRIGCIQDEDAGMQHLQQASSKGHLISKFDLIKNAKQNIILRPISYLKLLFLSMEIFILHLTKPSSLRIYK